MNVSKSMHKSITTTDKFEVKERIMIAHNLLWLILYAVNIELPNVCACILHILKY